MTIAYYVIHSLSSNNELSEVGAVHLAEGLAKCTQLEKVLRYSMYHMMCVYICAPFEKHKIIQCVCYDGSFFS